MFTIEANKKRIDELKTLERDLVENIQKAETYLISAKQDLLGVKHRIAERIAIEQEVLGEIPPPVELTPTEETSLE